MNLSDKIKYNLNHRISKECDFDMQEALRSLLVDVDLVPEDCGGSISFRGKDPFRGKNPLFSSVFRVGAASSLALMAKSVAAAKIWQMRTGKGQNISLDVSKGYRRIAGIREKNWELLNGEPLPTEIEPDNSFNVTLRRTKDGRFVQAFSPYPEARTAFSKFLGLGKNPDEVSVKNAISKWNGKDLELAGIEAGLPIGLVRTVEEFMLEEQFKVLAQQPLIELVKVGESAPEPFTPPTMLQPLSNIRTLLFGKVLAGPAAGRALALHGADVLNIWGPDKFEPSIFYNMANVGVRSSTLNLRMKDGFDRMKSLLKTADVFISNRRPGYVDSLGLSLEEVINLRPGIIDARVSLCGYKGPWGIRAGYDPTALCIAGYMALEGTKEEPTKPYVFVVTDFLSSWLLAAGIMAALAKRAVDGGSYSVRVSLARIVLWIYSLGIFDKQYAYETTDSGLGHTYLEPELFIQNTLCGTYQGLTDQVHMTETPGYYTTVLVPRGSCKPEWLEL